MGRHTAGRALLLGTLCVVLAACEGQDPFEFLKTPPASESGETPVQTETTGQTIEAEAPEVFGVSDTGLWDGRPSLGGVWVAYPEVADPERVVIRNQANGSFVIGALFRRERDNPGPRFQVSSDAAAALNILAGQPTELEVVALRKVVTERAAQEAEAAATAAAAPAPEPEPAGIDPAAVAAAAIAQSEGRDIDFDSALPQSATAGPVETTPLEAPAPVASSLEKPYIQIGIFSEEANARRTTQQMSDAGLAAETLEQESQGKQFFRVIVGPAPTIEARAQALASVRALGFTDAYFVTN
ncbi:SPOR domain-containing protein [Tropicimonas sp. S265A]|uniref:SPOR domain-containing protein n=1 Tax=Tropicimonas sp. S265A TaxID=3415134 RepID=UPI003C7A392F